MPDISEREELESGGQKVKTSRQKVTLDFSILNSKGSKQGFLVMVRGEGINESIGCEFIDMKAMVDFMEYMAADPYRMDQFLPDSDYKDVRLIYID